MLLKMFINHFLSEFKKSIDHIDKDSLKNFIMALKKIKNQRGRIFFLGVGGSAGNCSHAVNDFRKLLQIESYAPTDNPSEITARTNDEGFETVFEEYLKVSQLKSKDCIFVLSVGGGNLKKKVSVNLIKAINYAKKKRAKIFGIVARNDGFLFKKADYKILVKVKDGSLITPISESMQVLIWHLIVSDKNLTPKKTKW